MLFMMFGYSKSVIFFFDSHIHKPIKGKSFLDDFDSSENVKMGTENFITCFIRQLCDVFWIENGIFRSSTAFIIYAD